MKKLSITEVHKTINTTLDRIEKNYNTSFSIEYRNIMADSIRHFAGYSTISRCGYIKAVNKMTSEHHRYLIKRKDVNKTSPCIHYLTTRMAENNEYRSNGNSNGSKISKLINSGLSKKFTKVERYTFEWRVILTILGALITELEDYTFDIPLNTVNLRAYYIAQDARKGALLTDD